MICVDQLITSGCIKIIFEPLKTSDYETIFLSRCAITHDMLGHWFFCLSNWCFGTHITGNRHRSAARGFQRYQKIVVNTHPEKRITGLFL
jgi:hypothetical protein